MGGRRRAGRRPPRRGRPRCCPSARSPTSWPAQRERLRIWSGTCDRTRASPTPTPTPTPAPTPAPTKPQPDTRTDPRFRTCGDANRAGYGPYYRGRDPEYAWYQDRDGDGVVCER
ncbi:excalibur calcium-binding domain-containing protein [Nonomuraea sp. NPDC003214]